MPSGNQCQRCKHYNGGLHCQAYPNNEIPISYLSGEKKHDIEQPEQVAGFVFSPRKNSKDISLPGGEDLA